MKSVEVDEPRRKLTIEEAKIAGDLGVMLVDFHPVNGRKSETVYMHFRDHHWTRVKRIDVWGNNPRYLFPRTRIPETLHKQADELDAWVLKRTGGNRSQ